MSFLGDLIVRLKAETGDFVNDMGKAEKATKGAFGEIEHAAKTLAGALAIGGVAEYFDRTIEGADKIVKLSDKTGVAVQTLTEMKVAAELGGASIDSLAVGISKFEKSLVEANRGTSKQAAIFKAMGVDIRQGPNEAFRQFADSLSTVQDPALKTSVAIAILGKGAMELLPMLKDGSKGLDEAAEHAKKLGIVYGEDFARQAERFKDNLTLLKLGSEGLAIAILDKLLPPLTRITDEMVRGRETGGAWAGFMAGLGRYLFEVFDGVDDPIQRAQRDMVELTDKVIKAQNEFDRLGGKKQLDKEMNLDAAISPIKRVAAELDTLKAKYEDAVKWRDMLLKGQAAGPIKPEPAKKKVNDDKLRAAASGDEAAAQRKVEAEAKAFLSARQGLEEKLAGMTNQTEAEIVSVRTLTGSWKELTQPHKDELILLAQEIDKRKLAKEILDQQTKAAEAHYAASERASELIRQSQNERADAAEQARFELSLIGKTTDEVEKLNALRRVDLNLRHQLAQLATIYPDGGEAHDDRLRQLEEQAAREREIVTANIDARLKAERDWVTGAKQGMDDYFRTAADVASQVRGLYSDMFNGLEDAIVQFVTTGKLNFKSLADSIVADLVRIQVKKTITGPLSDLLDTGAKGLLKAIGVGGSSAAAAPVVQAGIPFGIPLAEGMDRVPYDGMPATLHKDEAVLTAAEASAWRAGQGTTATVAGNTYNIDARGADVGVEARITRALYALAGPGVVEKRAVQATREASKR